MTQTHVGYDSETDLIGPGNVVPNLVCGTFAEITPDHETVTDLMVGGDVYLVLSTMLSETGVTIVCHHASFDLAVACKAFPPIIPCVFQALEEGRVRDTEIREKLMNLSATGRIATEVLPDGDTGRVLYSLADLELGYLGRDRKASKKGDDAWRLNYGLLKGEPASAYPEEAREYAIEDAVGALGVFLAQEARIAEQGLSVETETLRTAVSFALALVTSVGMRIDPVERDRIAKQYEAEYDLSNFPTLVEGGVVRPAEPPRPHARGAKNPDGTPKMTAGKGESVNTTSLKEIVTQVCMAVGREVPRTEKGAVSTESAFLETLVEFSPTLRQYVARKALEKIISTELPRMQADRVHFEFDVLKETGRTSSRASKLYPSANGQNIDPRVKPAYVADEKWLICSTDYSYQELVSLAQKCYSLFGFSVLRDVINRGHDPHTYLGAQLAFALDAEFHEACMDGDVVEPWAILDVFLSLKNSEEALARDFFKKWRKFAKPVGLGFPGGLGAETFVKYAAAQGVDVTIDEAKRLKELWLATYPEMPRYFDWINTACVDPRNREFDGSDLYSYVTPMGMVRSGATYCAAANGAALQSPSAEASTMALFNVVRACFDPAMGSILYGCRPCNFVHDEIMVLIPDDDLRDPRSREISRIMVEAMTAVCPDVSVRANPCLMYRWDKRAEPVFDDRGLLSPWTPMEK